MVKKKNQQSASKEQNIEILLAQQTAVILDAVDERLGKTEIRINQKIDHLITTLDKFLKRLTDTEDEFEIRYFFSEIS